MTAGIGIDVGGTKIWGVLGTNRGEIIAEYHVKTSKDRMGFLHQINEIIDRLIHQSGKSTSALSGIGIGIPGLISRGEGKIEWVPNLPELNGLNLADLLTDQWDLPVELKNDGQLALLGEHWLGAAQGYNHIVMLTIGTGIGGAIMIDGRLWEGSKGAAGSMGWLSLDLNDEGDPELGWFERMVSGTAINRRGESLSNRMNSRQLFEEGLKGDPDAAKLIADIGHCLGAGIANIASILDPEMIVVGGGVSLHLSAVLPYAKQSLQKYGSPRVRNLPIVPAKLLNQSGVLGALRLTFPNNG